MDTKNMKISTQKEFTNHNISNGCGTFRKIKYERMDTHICMHPFWGYDGNGIELIYLLWMLFTWNIPITLNLNQWTSSVESNVSMPVLCTSKSWKKFVYMSVNSPMWKGWKAKKLKKQRISRLNNVLYTRNLILWFYRFGFFGSKKKEKSGNSLYFSCFSRLNDIQSGEHESEKVFGVYQFEWKENFYVSLKVQYFIRIKEMLSIIILHSKDFFFLLFSLFLFVYNRLLNFHLATRRKSSWDVEKEWFDLI